MAYLTWKSVFFCSIFRVVFSFSYRADARIFQASNANDGDFPFNVMLQDIKHGNPQAFYQICSGTIITKNQIISAAHCFYTSHVKSPKEIRAIIGTNNSVNITAGLVIHTIWKIFVYGDFELGTIKDLAILQTKYGIQFDRYVTSLHIADNLKVSAPGNECLLVGWGRQKCYIPNSIPPILQFAYVTIRPTIQCEIYMFEINDAVICAGFGFPKSSNGDSGGPLICNGSLSGVVSVGPSCEIYPIGPVIYVNVRSYSNWIKQPRYIKSSTKYLKIAIELIVGFILFILFMGIAIICVKTCDKDNGLAIPFVVTI